MRDRQATINDVARLAGVSKATVSAVLNATGSVRASTRERVLDTIAQLNYRPARGGSARAGVRRSIGLLIKEADNPYYADITAGVRARAAEQGFTLLVSSSEGDYATERQAVELLYAYGVDGLLVTPVLDDKADLSHFFDLKRRNYPFVLLEAIRGVPASLVDVDNVEGSQRAAQYLIDGGHVRLVHFAGPSYSTHSRERVDGVRRACSASRVLFADDDVIPAGARLEDGYRAALKYFGTCDPATRPSAVTCYNDLVAIGVCRALAELGIRVPQNVSVVGYDDLPIAAYLETPLTSIRVPTRRMGEVATEMLIQRIDATGPTDARKIYLDVELVVRGSTAPFPGGDGPRIATAVPESVSPSSASLHVSSTLPVTGRRRAAGAHGSPGGPA